MNITQMRGVSTTCVNKQKQMFEHHINSNGYMYLRLVFFIFVVSGVFTAMYGLYTLYMV